MVFRAITAFFLIALITCHASAYQDDLVFVNKSYAPHVQLSIRLYESFEKFVIPHGIPFYMVIPEKDLQAFKKTFAKAKNDQKINHAPIFLTEEYVFKDCGKHVYAKAIKMNGWESQQVVKMCFGLLNISKNYMTLDSDVYFTKPFPVEILFKDGIIKTYYPLTPNMTSSLKVPFSLIKKVIGDKSLDYLNYVFDSGTWSSDLLRKLDEFIKEKDFADLIQMAPYEMQWYGTFVSVHHHNELYRLPELFSLTWGPEKAKRNCMPTEGYPWSYGLVDTPKGLSSDLYINPCSSLKSFIMRYKKLRKYISFYLFGNA